MPVTISSVDGCTLRSFNKIKYFSSEEVPDKLVQLARDLQVYEGSPTKIIEVNDAILPLRSKCLYDRDGVRIDESCVRRRKGFRQLIGGDPKTVSLPADVITINEPVVYLSWLQNHWGHFLTEGMSRLWALDEYPELKEMLGVYSCYNLPHKNIRDFIEALPFNIYIGGIRCDRAIRFRKAFIPAASFSCQADAYSVHHKAASIVADFYLGEERPEVSNQPVFLSRSRFGGMRSVRNQNELEEVVTKLGFLVVYPENLTLAAQIKLFNQYRCFTGCFGSAFHTTILCRCPETIITHALCERLPNIDFWRFDSILGNEANYVFALPPVPGENQMWPHLNLAIDVEKAASYFETLI